MSDTFSTRRRIGRRPLLGIAAAALVAVGGGAGALAVGMSRPSVTMAPATPIAIRSLGGSDGIVTVRGRVAEIFGDKFVMADATGRALVELGREGGNGTLVAAGEPVTVQGRFDHGSLHAAFLVKADGKVTALGPLGRPRHDHRGPEGRPGDDDAADRDAPAPTPPAGPAPTAGVRPAS